MFRKLLLALAALVHSSTFAFTIINQTDSKKIITLKESYRPQCDIPGNLERPIPLGYKVLKVIVPAKSSQVVFLREPCGVILMGITTKEKKKNGEKTTCHWETCYEPYSYNGQNEQLITDEWGIVIHEPFEQTLSLFDPNYSDKSYFLNKAMEQGYGIKCLHPKILEKINSFDSIPDELKDISQADQSVLSRRISVPK